MDESKERAESTVVRVDLTGQDVRVPLPDGDDDRLARVLSAVLEFGRVLLRDDDDALTPAVTDLAAAIGAEAMSIELFADGTNGSEWGAVSDRTGGDHWVPVTLDGAWVGTVSMSLARPIDGYDRWALEAVADLFEGWVQRRQIEDRLRDTIAEKDRFVATVSHEIRTPLSAVLGLASEIHERGAMMDPAEVHELLGVVVDQAREVTDIVEDLLVIARAGRTTISVSPTEVHLDELVRSAIGSVPTAARSGLVMRNVEHVSAVCDPLRTRQIVRNLVVNAHRHGGPHTAIDVVTIPGGDAVIRVADNGEPIPPDRQATMFEPFSGSDRADGQLASVGLGLTVCRQLARAMGGDLLYRWQGESRFEVLLPRP